ncbi:TVP38/TMEM64 family protein [Enterococcus canis]|uniref:TVP38/TMEM64 family protein n=1 Tax=Enterococcus canis TaxID=214095 RepID=UPI00082A8CE1|nr:VTT domain-containing protein [Enterococcus canis]
MTDKEELAKRGRLLLKVLGALLILLMLSYILHFGLANFSNSLYHLVSEAGVWGPLLFIFFQIIQVIIPILPGGFSLSVGVLAFGSTLGFVYNYIGIVLGSISSFFLIRRFGRQLLRLLISEKSYNKYMSYLADNKKFTRFFIAAILFPIAPDDLLCMIAGLSKMRARTFILTIVLCKPFSIYVYGYGLTALLKLIFHT